MENHPKIGGWFALAFIVLILALALSACSSQRDAAKAKAYSVVAKVGNAHCDENQGPLRDILLEKMNRGLAAEGARFRVGLECTSP